MTRNEKIAEKMGWIYLSENIAVPPKGELIECFDPEHNIVHAKLLQARMVADKHLIKIMNNWDGEYMAESVLSCKNSIISDWCADEPAALHALFCKVYNIGGERWNRRAEGKEATDDSK